MKIIDKKNDYYDTALAYISEPDNSCVYLRKTIINYKKKIDGQIYLPLGNLSIDSHQDFGLKPYILIFCGRTIPFVKVSYRSKDKNQTQLLNFFAYTKEELLKFLDSHNFQLKKRKTLFYSWSSRSFETKEGLEYFFNQNKKDLTHMHHTYKSPSILWVSGQI